MQIYWKTNSKDLSPLDTLAVSLESSVPFYEHSSGYFGARPWDIRSEAIIIMFI